MKKNKKKVMSFREAWKLNVRTMKLMYKRFPQLVASNIIFSLWDAATPFVGIYLAARVVEELAGGRDKGRLIFLVLLTLSAAAVISLLTALLKRWVLVHQNGATYKRSRLFEEKLLDMDFVDNDDSKTRGILSTIEQNQNSGGRGIIKAMGLFPSFLSAIISIVGGLALSVSLFTSKVPKGSSYAFLNNPLAILAVIGMMLAITYLAPALMNKASSIRARNAGLHNFANRIFSYFILLGSNDSVASDVRLYEQEKMCAKYNLDKKGVFCSQGPYAKLAKGPVGLLAAASAAVSVMFTGFAYFFVCLKAWAGAFGIGMVTQYIGAISRVSDGVGSLVRTIGDIRNNGEYLKLCFDFLDIPNNMYQGSLTVEKRRDRDYEVEFCDVSFKYPAAETYALRHVNMKFKVGERLAVVGMNGSGKTTFIKLLCRLYDPTEGVILLNGIDIRKYQYDDYMNIFSVVFQDFQLFPYKLGENVASGRKNYDRALVTDCLAKAGFGERLSEMKDGLDTYLYKDYSEEGVQISGGEAQKIAIARALYKNAPFIILDEPTAALDPMAEADIYAKFNDIAGDKTAIYISHRLSSCVFCDEIAVFHEGAVVQKGTHEALLAEDGKYAELWNAQAQYYTDKTA